MSGRSPEAAALNAKMLLLRSHPGRRSTLVQSRITLAQLIARALWRRFQVLPGNWRVKHIRWYLIHHTADLAPKTRYDHWRAIRAITDCLGKTELWACHLAGSWQRPTGRVGPPGRGGRPAVRPPGPPRSPTL